MSEVMFCPNCNTWIEEPSVHTTGPEWVRFHIGRCPKCETPLQKTRTPREDASAGQEPTSKPVRHKKSPKQPSMIDRFRGKFTHIVVGGHKFGPIGDRRLRIAATHVCQQIEESYSRYVEKGSATTDVEAGSCFINITFRKGTDQEQCKQIGQRVNGFLDTEVLYQNYVDELILLIGEYDLVGKDEGFLGSARTAACSIGEKMHNQLGVEGMRYVCSIFGELWPHTGLMRSLESAWHGIGTWRA